MNYNNQNNNGYQRNNNNGNYNNNNGGYNGNNNQRERRKHSGAKAIVFKKGNHQGERGISAWNYSKERGMLSILCTPYTKTQEVQSKSGKVWQNWMVKVTNKRTLVESLHSGMYNVQNGKLTCNDLGFIINPSAPNGGYCGTFKKK